MNFRLVWVCAMAAAAMPAYAQITTTLTPQTIAEFERYQAGVDSQIASQISGAQPFLWIQQRTEERRRAEAGEVVTHAFTGSNGLSVTGGLVHDWVGVVYLKGLRLDAVKQFLLDTERHPRAYSEVKAARTLSRSSDQSVTKLRMVKKKVLTVVLDAEYANQWQSPGPDKWAFSARSRKIEEVERSGGEEKILAAGTGYGFLWRMNSQWLLREDDGGVWAELRVVSLSRDAPHGLGWMIKPMIRDFPAEGITSTLRQTQQALMKR